MKSILTGSITYWKHYLLEALLTGSITYWKQIFPKKTGFFFIIKYLISNSSSILNILRGMVLQDFLLNCAYNIVFNFIILELLILSLSPASELDRWRARYEILWNFSMAQCPLLSFKLYSFNMSFKCIKLISFC